MKKSFSLTINLALIIVILLLLNTGFASGTDAGTTSDPIVTQSYVEGRINALNASIDERLKKLESGSSGGSQVAFNVFKVEKGQTIMLEENSLFILRAGDVVAVIDPSAGGGISDLTTGLDVANNEGIVKNHLLLTPRTDGRGVKFNSEGWVMISGGYTVK